MYVRTCTYVRCTHYTIACLYDQDGMIVLLSFSVDSYIHLVSPSSSLTHSLTHSCTCTVESLVFSIVGSKWWPNFPSYQPYHNNTLSETSMCVHVRVHRVSKHVSRVV
jgi:hypothetical protein